jgi:hypothetical protein
MRRPPGRDRAAKAGPFTLTTGRSEFSLRPARWGRAAPEGRRREFSRKLNDPSPGAPHPLRLLPAGAGRGEKTRIACIEAGP